MKTMQRKKNKKAFIQIPGLGHVEYSGYGVHGNLGKSRNKSQRKKNRIEAKMAMRMGDF